MKKFFPKNIFLGFHESKKIKVLLDLANHIINQKDPKDFQKLKNYFDYFNDDISINEIKLLKEFEKFENFNEFIKGGKKTYFFYLLNSFSGKIEKEEDFLSTDRINKLEKDTNHRTTFPIYLFCDFLRSAHNIGSIFRLADCFGVRKIYFHPLNENTFENTRESINKVSMNTLKYIPHEICEDLQKKMESFDGIKIALELTKNSVSLGDFNLSSLCSENNKNKIAIFIGNEQLGLPEELLNKMDQIIQIKMFGAKNSLNVTHALSCLLSRVSEEMSKTTSGNKVSL